MPDQIDHDAIRKLDRVIEARRAGLPADGDAALAELADLALTLEQHWAESPVLDTNALWTRVSADIARTRQRRGFSALRALRSGARATPLMARAAVAGAAAMVGGLALLLSALAVQDARSEAAFVNDVRGFSGFAHRALTDQHLTNAEQAEVERRVLALARVVEADPSALEQLDGAQLESVASALGGIAERLSPPAGGEAAVSTSVESIAVLAQRVDAARQALQPAAARAARRGSGDARTAGSEDKEHGEERSGSGRATSTAIAAASAPPPAATALTAAFPFCNDGPASNVSGCQRALDRATGACAPPTTAAVDRSALTRCRDAVDAARRSCDRLQSRAEDQCSRRLDALAAQAKQPPNDRALPTPTARSGWSGDDRDEWRNGD